MLTAAAVYIGYVGAIGGIVVLAVLSAMMDQPMARINAVKNVVNGLANAAATVGFALFGPVRWGRGSAARGRVPRRRPDRADVGPPAARPDPPRVVVGTGGLILAVRLGIAACR